MLIQWVSEWVSECYHHPFPYHGLETKYDLHVFDGRHKSGQKSVGGIKKANHSLKVFHVPVFHDGVYLGRHNTQPPRILKAQRLWVHLWPVGSIHNCEDTTWSHIPLLILISLHLCVSEEWSVKCTLINLNCLHVLHPCRMGIYHILKLQAPETCTDVECKPTNKRISSTILCCQDINSIIQFCIKM